MWISNRQQRIEVWAAAILLATLSVGGIALRADEDPAAGDEGKSATTSGEAQDSASAVGDEEAWLFDVERDRRYRVDMVPKVERAYRWVDEDHVKLVLGFVYEVVKHDDEWFWVKVWEEGPPMDPRPRKTNTPSAEELAEVAKDYVVDIPEVDRVSLGSFDEGLPRRGQWRNGFDLADVNADGHLDIVFGPSRKGTPRPNLFLGNGAGQWHRWSEASFPRLPYDYGDAAAADFNGDGHMDLAFGVHLRGLIALIGDGQGAFEPWMEGIAIETPGKGGDASSFSTRAIEAVDWDGDGRVDILALGEGPKGTQLKQGQGSRPIIDTSRGFALFRNRGDGSWENLRLEENPYDFGDDFTMADVTGDGEMDLVVATRIHDNRWAIKAGSKDGKMTYEEFSGMRPGALMTAVEAADFNGDGRMDLAVGYMVKQLGVWRTGLDLVLAREGDEEWELRPLYVVEYRNGIRAIAVGALDEAEGLDIVAATGNGELLAFLGDGTGEFVREAMPEAPPLEDNCSGWTIRLANLDGSVGDEIVVSYGGEESGMPGMEGLHRKGCKDGGSIRVWSPSSKESMSAGAKAGAEDAP